MHIHGPMARRPIVAIIVLGILLFIVLRFFSVLASEEMSGVDIAILILFSLCLAHLLFSFVLAVVGFILALQNRDPLSLKSLSSITADIETGQNNAEMDHRIAIVVPAYREDLGQIVNRLSYLYHSLSVFPLFHHTDFYILSDSPKEDEEKEIACWSRAVIVLGAQNKLFYRRRTENKEKKSGNVKEFLEQWGNHYKYFCVLDADSIITGKTIFALHRAMEADQKMGICQTVPRPVHGRSLFSRIIEWNSLVYSRVFSSGFAFWQADQANYWGHNALIRVDAFKKHCALPHLSGTPPFGGLIMSHDFVESTFMIRSGYKSVLLPHIEDTFEEMPHSVKDYLKRDRRWMLGNLQHLRVSLFPHLTLFSRFQLFFGAYCYLSSFIWLLFLGTATVKALIPVERHSYFTQIYQLFPDWPVSHTLITLSIYIFTLGLLVIPKILGLIEYEIKRETHKSTATLLRLPVNFIMEFLVSVLLAPVIMYYHVRFIFSFLFGITVDWAPQNREVTHESWLTHWQNHKWVSLFGLSWLITILFSESHLILWIIPVIIPLIIAPLSSFLLEHPRSFAIAERLQLFETYAPTIPEIASIEPSDVIVDFPRYPEVLFSPMLVESMKAHN
ncbi:MAG: glucans biosynthesis glucosyltransferase MdoH [Candidatus Scalindua sp.]|nr:glucans biosynthesis glucosyltransferase MdoH [Candidatus Scalindua sp.]